MLTVGEVADLLGVEVNDIRGQAADRGCARRPTNVWHGGPSTTTSSGCRSRRLMVVTVLQLRRSAVTPDLISKPEYAEQQRADRNKPLRVHGNPP